MNIKDAILFYQNKGYEYADAESKVSQDIVLSKIWNSKYKNNITIKGGVVMYNISNNIRRATRDLDIDFIMRQGCYQDGMNCYNCLEGCDTLDILEQLHKRQEKTNEES